MRAMSMEVYVVWCARRSPPREIVQLKNWSGSARPGGVFDFEVRSFQAPTQSSFHGPSSFTPLTQALRLHLVCTSAAAQSTPGSGCIFYGAYDRDSCWTPHSSGAMYDV